MACRPSSACAVRACLSCRFSWPAPPPGPEFLAALRVRVFLAPPLEPRFRLAPQELEWDSPMPWAGPLGRRLPETVRAHLFISGTVQGVSFRASTQGEARRLGISGWVKNLTDGRVEAILQGPQEKVDDLIRWCHRGPPAAKVEKVELSWEKIDGEFSDFDVRP